MSKNVVRFVEIPVSNLTRASEFYKAVFNIEFENLEMGNAKVALFCLSENQTKAALVQGDGYVPSTTGVLLYFSADNTMHAMLDNIPKYGGRVTMERCSLAGHGFIARFIDTEGNKLGLHSEI